MELSYLAGFYYLTSVILVIAYFIDQHPSTPNIFRSLFRWGKMRIGFVIGGRQVFEIPKRWYQHFYLVGIFSTATLSYFCWRKVFWSEPWPGFLAALFKLLQQPCPLSFSNTDAVPVLLVLAMETLQVCRRSYETFFVNVFSKSATMTLLHYVLGVFFYLSIGLCVVAGTNFAQIKLPESIPVSHWLLYGVAVTVFIAASLLQHQSFRILAALRADKKAPEETGYLIPRGGLFDLVACPHFLAEITIYLSFCCVFGVIRNQLLLSLFVFVLVNQSLAAVLNYQWYCQNFPGYGKERYAIFPFLL